MVPGLSKLGCGFTNDTLRIHSIAAAAAAAKSLQSCPTLCNPIDGSPPGSSIPGIIQARTLEWVAISFSNAWKWEVKEKLLSRVQLAATPWTAPRLLPMNCNPMDCSQAPLSMGFSRQEYWSELPLPCPHNIANIIQFINLNSKVECGIFRAPHGSL